MCLVENILDSDSAVAPTPVQKEHNEFRVLKFRGYGHRIIQSRTSVGDNKGSRFFRWKKTEKKNDAENSNTYIENAENSTTYKETEGDEGVEG
ncbi:hypothetical protein VNO80_16496 [Phaseolus coccineus]|uniref:Uncharacterized protein n=1 Tax=Phaseolus coccineus TaxID=3886 RepID=A0AAN9R2S9_PHACN